MHMLWLLREPGDEANFLLLQQFYHGEQQEG